MATIKTAKAFKAVVLAGGVESLLYPYQSTPQKSLLPILNKPLIQYQIELLERSGFDSCILMCSSGDETELREYIEQYITTTEAQFIIRVVSTQSTSVLDALRELTQNKQKSKRIVLDCDFVVLPCDLISSESLTKLLAYHHHKRATMTMILTQPPNHDNLNAIEDAKKAAVTNPTGGKTGAATATNDKDKKAKKTQAPTPSALINPLCDADEYSLRVGINHDDGKLIYLKEIYDDERVVLHKDILRQCNSFTVYTNLTNPSVYVFSSDVVTVLQQYKELHTFKQLAQFLTAIQFVPQNPRYNTQTTANQHYSFHHLQPTSPKAQPSLSKHNSFHTQLSEESVTDQPKLSIAHSALQATPALQRGFSILNSNYPYRKAAGNVGGEDSGDEAVMINSSLTLDTDIAGHMASTCDSPTASLPAETHYLTPALTQQDMPALKNIKKKLDISTSLQNVACYAIIPPAQALLQRCDNIPTYIFLNKRLIEKDLPRQWLNSISLGHNYLEELKEKIAQQEQENARIVAEAAAAAAVTEQTASAATEDAKGKKGKKIAAPKVPKTLITGGWFGEEVSVDDGAMIINSVIGKYTKIGKGSSIKNCIIMDYVVIGDNVKLDNCVIGANTKILAGVTQVNEQIPVGQVISQSQTPKGDEDNGKNQNKQQQGNKKK